MLTSERRPESAASLPHGVDCYDLPAAALNWKEGEVVGWDPIAKQAKVLGSAPGLIAVVRNLGSRDLRDFRGGNRERSRPRGCVRVRARWIDCHRPIAHPGFLGRDQQSRLRE